MQQSWIIGVCLILNWNFSRKERIQIGLSTLPVYWFHKSLYNLFLLLHPNSHFSLDTQFSWIAALAEHVFHQSKELVQEQVNLVVQWGGRWTGAREGSSCLRERRTDGFTEHSIHLPPCFLAYSNYTNQWGLVQQYCYYRSELTNRSSWVLSRRNLQ